MAEALKWELGVNAVLKEGGNNEFTVWVNGKLVAKKRWLFLPTETAVVKAVRGALARTGRALR